VLDETVASCAHQAHALYRQRQDRALTLRAGVCREQRERFECRRNVAAHRHR